MIKKIFLIGLILLCLISGVNAETFEETYEENIFKDSTSIVEAQSTVKAINYIYILDYTTPDRYKGAYFLTYDGAGGVTIQNCNENVNYPIKCYEESSNQLLFTGHIAYDNDYNLLNQKTHGYFWINIDYIATNNISTLYNSNRFNIYSLDYSSVLSTTLSMGVANYAGFTDTSVGNIFFARTPSGGDIAAGGLHIYYQYPFETSVSGEYNVGQFSTINVERKDYVSNFTLYDLDGNLIKNDYNTRDIENFIFPKSAYRYTIQNEAGTVWEKTLQATTELDLSVIKSKDKVLVLNEEETYYLKGLTSLDNIKTIIWTTQKLKDDGSRDENYYPTGERYQRINSTHFEKFVMANGAVLSEDILPVSTDFLEISESFTEDGQYKTSCDIFEMSASGLGILIGSPYVLTEVSDVGELVKIKVITINSETAGTISNCDLNVYKLNSSGETLYQNVLMSSSSTNVNLEFGELYRFKASKTGYVDAEVIKQITTPDIIILYLKPASGDGFTTASFTVRDTDKNRLADVKIEMDGKTRYTNTGGIATFTELNQNSTYTYTITHPDYVEETGTIETELEDLVNIEVVLYKETEVYPTPTETEGPSWINEKPSNMKESFLLSFYMITGIEDLETLKLLSGVLLSALIGIIAASITKDGTGFLAGGIIGFIGAVGLGWIPIWLLIALIVITGCYFIFSRGDN